jgi:hypothetical protein
MSHPAKTDLEILALYAEVTKAEYEAVKKLIRAGTREQIAGGVQALREAGRLPSELVRKPNIYIPTGRN